MTVPSPVYARELMKTNGFTLCYGLKQMLEARLWTQAVCKRPRTSIIYL